MCSVVRVKPKNRLNVGANCVPPDLDYPNRLYNIPKYRCPHCKAVTAFDQPAQTPLHIFSEKLQSLFDEATPRETPYYPAITDGECRVCNLPFRVVADYTEVHGCRDG
jgi:hypothetical protein